MVEHLHTPPWNSLSVQTSFSCRCQVFDTKQNQTQNNTTAKKNTTKSMTSTFTGKMASSKATTHAPCPLSTFFLKLPPAVQQCTQVRSLDLMQAALYLGPCHETSKWNTFCLMPLTHSCKYVNSISKSGLMRSKLSSWQALQPNIWNTKSK